MLKPYPMGRRSGMRSQKWGESGRMPRKSNMSIEYIV
jgi:hypothetical protein